MSLLKPATIMCLKLMSIVMATLFAGCAVNPATVNLAANAPQSLGSNRRLPADEIKGLYSPQLWKRLRDESYSAYVIVEADVPGNRLTRRRIVECYPNDSRNGLALALLEEVELKVSTIGTNIIPLAVAYVIFYERNLDGDLAVIYAKQLGYSAPGEKGEAQFFVARKF